MLTYETDDPRADRAALDAIDPPDAPATDGRRIVDDCHDTRGPLPPHTHRADLGAPRWASRTDGRYHARRPIDATLGDAIRADVVNRERVTINGESRTLGDIARTDRS